MNVFTGVKWRQGDHQEDKSSNPISKKQIEKNRKRKSGKIRKTSLDTLGLNLLRQNLYLIDYKIRLEYM